MAEATNVSPNMIRTIAPAMSPERMFLRARRRSMGARRLQLHVGNHGAEEKRQVGQREQVELESGATIRPSVEPPRPAEEGEPEDHRADQVGPAEGAGAEREL